MNYPSYNRFEKRGEVVAVNEPEGWYTVRFGPGQMDVMSLRRWNFRFARFADQKVTVGTKVALFYSEISPNCSLWLAHVADDAA